MSNDTHINDNTYRHVYAPNHPHARQNGCIYEHRAVVEEKIGRILTLDEVIHHMDGNKRNNDPDNLIIFRTNSDHSRFHETGVLVEHDDGTFTSPPLTKNCAQCGTPFRYDAKDAKFCTPQCVSLSQRKTVRPDKDVLIKTLMDFGSFTQVGKYYGVSDNAIRKWCKAYDLPTTIKYYRQHKKEPTHYE